MKNTDEIKQMYISFDNELKRLCQLLEEDSLLINSTYINEKKQPIPGITFQTQFYILKAKKRLIEEILQEINPISNQDEKRYPKEWDEVRNKSND